MFESLTQRLNQVLQKVRGQGRITEDNIKDTLREVRVALLEADVALPVVKSLIDNIRERSLGQEVITSISPGQLVVKIVNDELTAMLGSELAEFNLATRPPAVILMAGLQGSGKTTTTAKLARWIKEQHKKTVMLVSTDIYRPAAIDQLEILAKEVEANFFPSNPQQRPSDIVRDALEAAKRQLQDVLIIDTAGRLHIDEAMMDEIKQLHALAQPIETLFVVDSMTGQDAVNTAKVFNENLELTGIILTKTDGDARGGAALSMRSITGKPIKFVGAGEKTTALTPFHPDRMASRILGMGDIVSLVEEAHQKMDQENAVKLAKKLKQGKSFDLEDFRDQIQQMNKLGGMAGLLDKLPGMINLPAGAASQLNDGMLKKIEAIINSMTPQERRFPDIIRGSRKRRIAAGSGTEVQDINRLLKQFVQMQKMMKRFTKQKGLMNMLRGFGQ